MKIKPNASSHFTEPTFTVEAESESDRVLIELFLNAYNSNPGKRFLRLLSSTDKTFHFGLRDNPGLSLESLKEILNDKFNEIISSMDVENILEEAMEDSYQKALKEGSISSLWGALSFKIGYESALLDIKHNLRLKQK